MKRTELLLLLAAILFFVTGTAFYPYLPPILAAHWNTQGQVNGYISRGWGTFLFPAIFVFIAFLFFLIPRIDPKKENIAKFRKYFDYIVITIVIFFYYIYLLSLVWNIGYRFNFVMYLVPAFAVLFYIIGAFLPHIELNWMIGIRTPWTISSESVWKKTHEVGSTAFKISAIVMLIGMLFPTYAVWFLGVPLAASAVGLIAYSYVLYQREQKGL